MVSISHLNTEELTDGLPHIRQAPGDNGELKAIVIRPSENERTSLTECALSPELGVHGDNWATDCWLRLEDGRPHPDVQVTLINARLLHLVAGDEARWSLAGDQLCVDLDLSLENLPVGQQLSIGSVVLQVTDQPHTGCAKFAHRFGNDALRFVNSPDGKALRLRGMYARVVREGQVSVGDRVTKVRT